MANSQENKGTELGIDLAFSMSGGLYKTGTVGIGLKYGVLLNENLIVGPSFRYHRTWTNNTQSNVGPVGFNIFGGGGFLHYRFANYLFAGTEIEFLKSPYTQNGQLSTSYSKWVGTFLIGGGFSGKIGENLRLNAGVMYDVLDIPNPTDPGNPNPNSPLQPYLTRNSQGVVVPIVYRIAFFIPLS